MPAAVVYAVMKHRVLEVPVLLRRSARDILVQRGFVVLLVVTGAAIVVLAASWLSRTMGPAADTSGEPRVAVALGAALAGVTVVWILARVHGRIAPRIDRAFFRSAYDARQILEDLIERSRSARNREELLGLLRHHLDQALQPTLLVVYLRDGDRLIAVDGSPIPTAGRLPAALGSGMPLLAALARYGRPWDTADASVADLHAAAADLRPTAECLVPVFGREGDVNGLIVLGPRRRPCSAPSPTGHAQPPRSRSNRATCSWSTATA